MPLKREPEAVSAVPLGTRKGETVVSKGCKLGSKPRPTSYSSALLRRPTKFPPANSTLPLGSNAAVCCCRAWTRLPVALHVPPAGSYSSALLRVPLLLDPPTTSALPLRSRVAVLLTRAVPRLPVVLQVPLAGLYSSALLKILMPAAPPATSTLPLGSSVA